MKRLVLYGAGKRGQRFARELQNIGIEFEIADSNPELWGTIFYGKTIISLPELCKIEEINIFITVADNKKQDVIDTLKLYHLDNKIIYTPQPDKVKVFAECNWGFGVECEGENYIEAGVGIYNIRLGKASYISTGSIIHDALIGRYSCIGPNVKIIVGQHPTYKFVSVHPAFYSIKNNIGITYVDTQKFDEHRYTPEGTIVTIGNDVWIGANVQIMEGVSIADGTIVAAGAVVVKDTMPYSIVGGIPAKHIKYRFSNEQIEFLMKLKWWNKDEEWIKNKAEYFDDIEKFMKKSV